jgi:hypothetical protein
LFLARFEQDAKEQEEKSKEEVGARSWVCGGKAVDKFRLNRKLEKSSSADASLDVIILYSGRSISCPQLSV